MEAVGNELASTDVVRAKRKYTKRGSVSTNASAASKRARRSTPDMENAPSKIAHPELSLATTNMRDAQTMEVAVGDASASPVPSEALAAANLRKKRGRKSKKEIQHEENQRKLISLTSHAHMLQVMNATSLLGLFGIFLRHPLQFELEARLGIYNAGRKQFLGGVSRQYFTALLELVRAFNDWDESESPDGWVHSRDIYHRNGVRCIKQMDAAEKTVVQTTYQTKERFADLDFVHFPIDVSAGGCAEASHVAHASTANDGATLAASTHPSCLYDMRISLRREIELPENHPVVQDLHNHTVEHVRKKARRSYGNRKRGIRIDFSIVWEGASEERVCNSATKGPETYEIELECLQPLNKVESQADSIALCKQFFSQATALLGTDQPIFMMPVGM